MRPACCLRPLCAPHPAARHIPRTHWLTCLRCTCPPPSSCTTTTTTTADTTDTTDTVTTTAATTTKSGGGPGQFVSLVLFFNQSYSTLGAGDANFENFKSNVKAALRAVSPTPDTFVLELQVRPATEDANWVSVKVSTNQQKDLELVRQRAAEGTLVVLHNGDSLTAHTIIPGTEAENSASSAAASIGIIGGAAGAGLLLLLLALFLWKKRRSKVGSDERQTRNFATSHLAAVSAIYAASDPQYEATGVDTISSLDTNSSMFHTMGVPRQALHDPSSPMTMTDAERLARAQSPDKYEVPVSFNPHYLENAFGSSDQPHCYDEVSLGGDDHYDVLSKSTPRAEAQLDSAAVGGNTATIAGITEDGSECPLLEQTDDSRPLLRERKSARKARPISSVTASSGSETGGFDGDASTRLRRVLGSTTPNVHSPDEQIELTTFSYEIGAEHDLTPENTMRSLTGRSVQDAASPFSTIKFGFSLLDSNDIHPDAALHDALASAQANTLTSEQLEYEPVAAMTKNPAAGQPLYEAQPASFYATQLETLADVATSAQRKEQTMASLESDEDFDDDERLAVGGADEQVVEYEVVGPHTEDSKTSPLYAPTTSSKTGANPINLSSLGDVALPSVGATPNVAVPAEYAEVRHREAELPVTEVQYESIKPNKKAVAAAAAAAADTHAYSKVNVPAAAVVDETENEYAPVRALEAPDAKSHPAEQMPVYAMPRRSSANAAAAAAAAATAAPAVAAPVPVATGSDYAVVHPPQQQQEADTVYYVLKESIPSTQELYGVAKTTADPSARQLNRLSEVAVDMSPATRAPLQQRIVLEDSFYEKVQDGFVRKTLDHTNARWFHGQIFRQEAERRLRSVGLKDGLFLVRERSMDSLAITMAYQGRICHNLLYYHKGKYCFKTPQQTFEYARLKDFLNAAKKQVIMQCRLTSFVERPDVEA
eukprot:m.201871 g.201871  ORF g.201871 m.201871 type:complete len:941 (+) comp10685_c0_seq1:104-2926(+)